MPEGNNGPFLCAGAILLLLLLGARPIRAQQGSFSSARPSLAASPITPPAEPLFRAGDHPAAHPHENGKLFVTLAVATYIAAGLDMHETMTLRSNNPYFREDDPLARPFTRLPAPAYYALGTAMVTGLNWVSLRMAHSVRWHRVWWLPQACSIGGNLFGYIYSRKQD